MKVCKSITRHIMQLGQMRPGWCFSIDCGYILMVLYKEIQDMNKVPCVRLEDGFYFEIDSTQSVEYLPNLAVRNE